MTVNRTYKFQNLNVYQNTLNFIIDISRIINILPTAERFALQDQLRRSSYSVLLNIAEGSGYYTNKSFIRFLLQARGSLYEVVACIELCDKLNYLDKEDVKSIIDRTYEIRKQINGLISYLKKN